MRQAAHSAAGAPSHDPLAGLGLSAEDVRTLAWQGFLAADFRQRGDRRLGPYYKLRWRRDGQQQVRYLGRDRARAEQVRAALADLQRPLRLARQLSRQMKEARRGLHKVKQMLASHLAGSGLYYHGYVVRRRLGLIGEAGEKTPAGQGKGASALPRTVATEGMSHERENGSKPPRAGAPAGGRDGPHGEAPGAAVAQPRGAAGLDPGLPGQGAGG